MTAEDFYIRLSNDESAKPTFSYANFEVVQQRINKLLQEGFDRIVFIVSEYSLAERDDIKFFIERENLENVYIIKTKLFLYPLVHAIKKINEGFKIDGDVNKLENDLHDLEGTFKMHFYVPEHDVLPTISKFEFDEDLFNLKKGLLYDGDKNGVILMKKYKNNYALQNMIEAFFKETSYINYIPFILYTNKYSKFISAIENAILSRNPNVKIEKNILSPYIGNAIGLNTIVLGFIMK